MSAAPPPNWYPDPHDRAQLRWWDGSQWTEHRHPVVTAVDAVDNAAKAADTADTHVVRTVDAREATAAGDATAAADATAVRAPVRAATPGASVFDQWASPASDTTSSANPIERGAPEPMTSWSTQSRLPAALPQPQPQRSYRPAPTPAPNRRPLFIGIGVIAVIVVAALVFALTRGGDSNDVATETTQTQVTTTIATATTGVPATTSAAASTTRPAATTAAPPTTAAPLAGTTFADPTNVYRLRVPATWSDATTIGGLQTWATGTSSSVFRDSVNVLIEKLPTDISMDDYLAASVRNAPKSLPSFVEVSRSVSTVNGKVLGQLDFKSSQQIALRHRAVVLIKGRNAIVVTYTAEPARFDAEVGKLQPYLQSVEGV